MSEFESWMNDQKPLVAHGEYGKDEDGTQALIKKHETVEAEIEGSAGRVEVLVDESEVLISRKHFDSHTIARRQVLLYCELLLYINPYIYIHGKYHVSVCTWCIYVQ